MLPLILLLHLPSMFASSLFSSSHGCCFVVFPYPSGIVAVLSSSPSSGCSIVGFLPSRFLLSCLIPIPNIAAVLSSSSSRHCIIFFLLLWLLLHHLLPPAATLSLPLTSDVVSPSCAFCCFVIFLLYLVVFCFVLPPLTVAVASPIFLFHGWLRYLPFPPAIVSTFSSSTC